MATSMSSVRFEGPQHPTPTPLTYRKHPMPNPRDYATEAEKRELEILDAAITALKYIHKERRKIMDRLYKRQKASEG